MLRNLARVLIVLLVLLAGMAVPFRSASAAAPTIVDAVANPNMVSLFGENWANSRSSPFGPGWAGIVVKTTGSSPAVTSVTAKLGDLLSDLLPADASSGVLSGNSAAFTAKIAELNGTALAETAPAGSGLWSSRVAIEELLGPVMAYFGASTFRKMVERELRTGEKTVTVIANNGTTKTGTVTLWVVDAQIMLRKGWNLRSTPMALGDTTWANVVALGNKTPIAGVALKYDAASSRWCQLSSSSNSCSPDTVSSLDGVYVYSTQDDAIGARLFRSASAVMQPAFKNLYRSSWNLIGTAPNFTQNFALVTANNMRGLLQIDTALVGLGSEWVTAISPTETNDPVTQTYSYTGIGTLGMYTWKFGTPSWSSVNRGDALPVLTTTSTGATVPFAGYWVFIQTSPSGLITPIVLNGMNSGILDDAWLLQLLTLSP